jgi:sulfoxide reductase catalytic subunit YedY
MPVKPSTVESAFKASGEFGRRDTLMFNGYADQVAQLYAGMDLKYYF